MVEISRKHSERAATRALRPFVLYAALAGVMLVAYWRVLHFPFIQDDWGWIYRFQTEGLSTFLKSIFAVKGVLFYRPLAELYLYLMYRAFGADPLPFHIVALLLHVGGACLVVAIVRRVTRDDVIAWAAGFVYALAVAIVLESLLWAVGIFDVGGVFFFLLSTYLFVKERPLASAFAYVIGCLFKDTVIVLPVVLFAYTMIEAPSQRDSRLSLMRTRLLPIAIALSVMVAVKLAGKQPQRLPISDPYAIRLSGPHVPILLSKYVFCMFQSFYPAGAIKSAFFKIVLWCLAILTVVTAWLASRPRRDAAIARAFWFFLLWCGVSLLPLLFLPNHSYRYYTIYALPAFIALVLTQLRVVATAARLGRRYARGLIIAVAAFAVLFSSVRAHTMLGTGLEWNTVMIEGLNNLVRKAALVDAVRDGLKKYLPKPPADAVILLGEVDVWAFNKDSGPRVWYGDTTISVYPLANLKVDSVGTYIENAFESQRHAFTGAAGGRRRVDPAKLFGFVLDDSKLRPVRFKGIPQSGEGGER
jgi:hypothetical protein